MSNIYKCFLIFLLILVMGGSLYSTMGEPVPGAEIYIELEPDDEPISNNSTNDFGEVSGFFTTNPPPAPQPRAIEIKIKLQELTIRKLKSNLERKYINLKGTGILGKYEFKMKTDIGSNKAEFKFFIDLKNEQDLKSLAYKPSGLFSQSISNIVSVKGSSIDAQASTPGIKKPVIKIPFKIKLELTSVNNYGINDEGIK